MGVRQTKKTLIFGWDSNTMHFLNVQGHWGHRKSKLDSTSNYNVLGFRNNFSIINPEHAAEYSKRVHTFCYKVILNGGNVFFFNSSNDNDEDLKKIINFFSLKSLQPTSNDWVIGNLSNRLINFKKFSLLVLPCINKNSFILKETSQKLIPVISVKDSNVTFDKVFQPFLGNDDSKEVYYYFYYSLSNIIIKAYLFKYSKNI